MALFQKEKSDRKMKRTADITVNGKEFEGQTVYWDTQDPKRRDVFVPSDISDNKSLPKTATVYWYGEKYKANLSFRKAQKGKQTWTTPVYQFRVE